MSHVFRVLIITISMLLATSPAHAKRGNRTGAAEELRLRLGVLFGNYMYSSGLVNMPVNSAFTLLQPGLKVDFEAWLPKSRLGVLVGADGYALDYKNRPDNFRGKPMRFALLHGSLGLRISGTSGAHVSQSVITVGPAAAIYPNVTTFTDQTYDVVVARYWGARVGMRNRIAFSKKTIFEWGAYYVQPLKVLGTSASLAKTDSRNIGANVLFDYMVQEGVSLSIGYYWGLNLMTYSPNGAWRDNQLKFQTNAGIASILFWL